MDSTESKQNSVIDEAGYRKIKIQDLPPVADTYNYPYDPKKNWKQLKCTHSKGCECKVLTYIENIDGTTYAHSNSFLGAFLKA